MAGVAVYVDTSVILRRLLWEPGAIEDWRDWESAVTSELLETEALRSLDRMRLIDRLSASQFNSKVAELKDVISGLELVALDRIVLRRAGAPLPVPLGTLDAIHLATAQLWVEYANQELTFATHNRQLGFAARALGFPVMGDEED